MFFGSSYSITPVLNYYLQVCVDGRTLMCVGTIRLGGRYGGRRKEKVSEIEIEGEGVELEQAFLTITMITALEMYNHVDKT